MRAVLSALLFTAAAAGAPPNVVWIVAEDLSPDLGCYGCPDAVTPNLDAFAAESCRYTRCFTHAPVCAPSRSGLITGMYPTSMGSHHMRSKLVAPPPLWVDDLRAAGYFVCWPETGKNRGKTDFNFDPPKGWADSHADWTAKPDVLPKGKPFFAYVNLFVTHESQARPTPQQYAKNTERLTPAQRHDPARVRLPAYYPDTPAVRKNVATYHDNVTAMDYQFADVMKLLKEKGLLENTVVFFFGDHGRGLPRGKRWCYDSGTNAPLLVRWPGTLRAGSVRDELVAFVDLGPTVLNIAGGKLPPRFHGQPFLGQNPPKPREYCFSARDRMDEAYDRIRSVRSREFRYVKNYHPELPYAQWLNYLDEMPIQKEWRRLAFAGELTGPAKAFFARAKPPEELYRIADDPDEVVNLADDPKFAAELTRHRTALAAWEKDTKDLGAVPEKELIARGLVRDVLTKEYAERTGLHPKTSPVPEK